MSSQVAAMIRRVVGDFLPDTCTIERESSTTGRFGEPTHDPERVAEAVSCRLIMPGQRYGSGVAEAAGAETLQAEYRLIVSADVTLGADMRVTTGGLTYNVVRVETALSDEAYHSAVLMRRD